MSFPDSERAESLSLNPLSSPSLATHCNSSAFSGSTNKLNKVLIPNTAPKYATFSSCYSLVSRTSSLTSWLANRGVETRGISPVTEVARTDVHFLHLFFLWLSANCNILSFSTGTIGPAIFDLQIRDACLVILFVNLLCCALPAYFSTFGPQYGLRQMVHARYSFGYFGAILPSFLNVITFIGFLVLNCILGGQTLSSASDGRLSWNVGIVLITLISLLITFCGYSVLKFYERFAWIPVLVVFIICFGIGGDRLSQHPPPSPAKASSILSFAASIASYSISWATVAADYTIYFKHDVPKTRIFAYAYFGNFLPIVFLQIMGAFFISSSMVVPEWADGYKDGGLGSLFISILSPAGNFGKLCVVILGLGVTAACAPTMYSLGISLQCTCSFFARIPRYAFSILSAAVVIPLSIVGSRSFYDALINCLGLIGYYASAFGSIVLIEHLTMRKEYDMEIWNDPHRLPSMWPAIGAFILSFGLVILSMDQVWFKGPIAALGTGDIGFEIAFITAGPLYYGLRKLEHKFCSTVTK